MPGASLVRPEPVLGSPETQAWLSFFAEEGTGALDGLESNVHWAESLPSKIPPPILFWPVDEPEHYKVNVMSNNFKNIFTTMGL